MNADKAPAPVVEQAEIDVEITETKSKIRRIIERIGKRNLVIIGAALIIGAAVLVNQLAFGGGDKLLPALDLSDIDAAMLDGGAEDGINDAEPAGGAADDYFTETSLSRRRARDEAMEVLLAVAESSTSLQDAKDRALGDISQIALDIENEANIESLIMSKGFEQCVAVVNGSTASVIVKSDGLLDNELAQIYEIVYSQAGVEPSNLRIIEKET